MRLDKKEVYLKAKNEIILEILKETLKKHGLNVDLLEGKLYPRSEKNIIKGTEVKQALNAIPGVRLTTTYQIFDALEYEVDPIGEKFFEKIFYGPMLKFLLTTKTGTENSSGSSAAKDELTKKSIKSRAYLLFEIFLRACLIALSKNNQEHMDGHRITQFIRDFIDNDELKKLLKESYEEQSFSKFVNFSFKRSVLDDLDQIIVINKIVNAPNTAFSSILEDIKKNELFLIGLICCMLVGKGSLGDLELSPFNLRNTLSHIENKFFSKLDNNFQSTREEDRADQIITLLKNKPKKDKVTLALIQFYEVYIKTKKLRLMLERLKNLINKTGWFFLLTNTINGKALSNLVEKQLGENDLLITTAFTYLKPKEKPWLLDEPYDKNVEKLKIPQSIASSGHANGQNESKHSGIDSLNMPYQGLKALQNEGTLDILFATFREDITALQQIEGIANVLDIESLNRFGFYIENQCMNNKENTMKNQEEKQFEPPAIENKVENQEIEERKKEDRAVTPAQTQLSSTAPISELEEEKIMQSNIPNQTEQKQEEVIPTPEIVVEPVLENHIMEDKQFETPVTENTAASKSQNPVDPHDSSDKNRAPLKTESQPDPELLEIKQEEPRAKKEQNQGVFQQPSPQKSAIEEALFSKKIQDDLQKGCREISKAIFTSKAWTCHDGNFVSLLTIFPKNFFFESEEQRNQWHTKSDRQKEKTLKSNYWIFLTQNLQLTISNKDFRVTKDDFYAQVYFLLDEYSHFDPRFEERSKHVPLLGTLDSKWRRDWLMYGGWTVVGGIGYLPYMGVYANKYNHFIKNNAPMYGDELLHNIMQQDYREIFLWLVHIAQIKNDFIPLDRRVNRLIREKESIQKYFMFRIFELKQYYEKERGNFEKHPFWSEMDKILEKFAPRDWMDASGQMSFDEIMGDIHAMHKNNQDLKDELSESKKENGKLDEKNKKLEKEKQALDDKNQALDDKNQALDDKNQALDDKNQALEEEKKAFEAEKKSLEEKMKIAEAEMKRSKELDAILTKQNEKEIADLKKAISGLEKEKQAGEENIILLEELKINFQGRIKELEKTCSDLEEKDSLQKEKIEESERKISSLNTRIIKMSSEEKQNNENKIIQELEGIKKQIQRMHEEHDKIKGERTDLEITKKRATKSLLQSQELINYCSRTSSELENNLKKAQEKIKELEGENKELEKQSQEWKKLHNKLLNEHLAVLKQSDALINPKEETPPAHVGSLYQNNKRKNKAPSTGVMLFDEEGVSSPRFNH